MQPTQPTQPDQPSQPSQPSQPNHRGYRPRGYSHGKHRGHGKSRQTAYDALSTSSKFTNLKKLGLGGALGGALTLLLLAAWFLWTYVPTPRAHSIVSDLQLQTVSDLVHDPIRTTQSAGRTSTLTLSLFQPADGHYAPDAYQANPPGAFGRATCTLSSHDLFGQTMFEFGATADFLYAADAVQIWVPASPIASSNFGWNAHHDHDQQSSLDTSTGAVTVWVSGDATLFTQSGNPESGDTFTVILTLYPSGRVVCGLLTSNQSNARPAIPLSSPLVRNP